MSLKPKLDARFLKLRALAERLDAIGEGMALAKSTNPVVASEALIALSLANQAGALLGTAAQSLGFVVDTLRMPLPKKRKDLEGVVTRLKTAADATVKVVMTRFDVNQQAASVALPAIVDELADLTDELIKRAETHFAAAKRANVVSVPQADGDDGQLTDAAVSMVDPK